MGRREPANVSKGGSGLVAVQSKQQKVAHCCFIQVCRNVRMLPQAIQDVAKQKELAKFGVVKGLDAEMVAGAKKFPLARVPDRERKIPAQALYAILSPNRIRPQNQIGVAGRAAPQRGIEFLALGHFPNQLVPAINARVSRNPILAGETSGLALIPRFKRGSQQGVAEARGSAGPGVARVRPAIREGIGQSLQQGAIDSRSAPLEHAHDPAHSGWVSSEEMARSKGTNLGSESVWSFKRTWLSSTQAWASNRPASFLAPIFRSAAKPWRRKSIHNTRDCSRQFAWKKRLRAAAV